nr:transcription repressor OFP6 [Ipomoea batatas]
MSAKPKKQSCKLKNVIKSGCGCGESTQAVEPKPKAPAPPSSSPPPSSSSTAAAMHGGEDDRREEILCRQMVSRSPKISGSIAVVKESDDPCGDFRQSMLQMIQKKSIQSQEDLQELLKCFLLMNPPSLHDIIVQAFTNILDETTTTTSSVVADRQAILVANAIRRRFLLGVERAFGCAVQPFLFSTVSIRPPSCTHAANLPAYRTSLLPPGIFHKFLNVTSHFPNAIQRDTRISK